MKPEMLAETCARADGPAPATARSASAIITRADRGIWQPQVGAVRCRERVFVEVIAYHSIQFQSLSQTGLIRLLGM